MEAAKQIELPLPQIELPSPSPSPSPLPPGYRFKPTDEELVYHYLMNKASSRAFQGQDFQDIDATDLYSKPPKSLVTFAQGEREWYFFILEDENFPVGRNSNRCVGNGMGFWKSTPEIRIYNGDESMIATKRYLTFFSGNLPGAKKTHWTMEEYRLHVNGCITKQNIKPKEWVLGRMTRGREYKTCL